MGRSVTAASALAFLAIACGIDIVGKIDSRAAANDGGVFPPGTTSLDGGADVTCSETTSPANCGACGHSCGTATCTGGLCGSEIVMSGLLGPSSVSVDGTSAFSFSLDSPPRVVRAPLAGGPPETVTPLEYSPVSLPLSGGGVYLGDQLGMVKVLAGGGTHGVTYPTGGRGNGLLFSTDLFGTSSNGGVYWCDSEISQTTFGQLAEDGGSAQGLAADATNVYWANPTSGFIGKATRQESLSGRPFITNQPRPTTVAVDDSNVYFTTPADIRRADKANGLASPIQTSLAEPVGIVLDGDKMYWIEVGSGDIKRASKEGGTPLLLAKGAAALPANSYTSILAVSPTHVYWASPAAGTVMRVAK